MIRRILAFALLTGAFACANPTAPGALLASVTPAGGATGVNPGGPIMLRWDRPMPGGMEAYVALHQGGVDGAVVPMTCLWSVDRSTLTCTPQTPLASGATYTIHVGGGMHDAAGDPVDMGPGMGMGGQWVTGGMMGGGMMGDSTMMGAGWKAGNGTYGMSFSFTTA